MPAAEGRLSSRSSPTLTSAVRDFLAQHESRPTIACFGIAGPVIGGRVETPNLPWVIDAGVLMRDLGLDGVWLINDLEANAYGLEVLDDDDFAVLNTGNPDGVGNRGVIAAGTGLGEVGTVATTGRSPAREGTPISLRATRAKRISFSICSADSSA